MWPSAISKAAGRYFRGCCSKVTTRGPANANHPHTQQRTIIEFLKMIRNNWHHYRSEAAAKVYLGT